MYFFRIFLYVSKVLLNFKSMNPMSYKIGIFNCLIYRAFKITSSCKLFHLEITFLRKLFSENNSPVNLFDKCVKSLALFCFPPGVKILPKTEFNKHSLLLSEIYPNLKSNVPTNVLILTSHDTSLHLYPCTFASLHLQPRYT